MSSVSFKRFVFVVLPKENIEDKGPTYLYEHEMESIATNMRQEFLDQGHKASQIMSVQGEIPLV